MDFRGEQEANRRQTRHRYLASAAVACFFLTAVTRVEAGQLIPLSPPIAFFTNVASRLLKSELNLELGALQIYPTNQYTPAVHRLLQVSANLYDSTTNRAFGGTSLPYCPTVFRPLFRRTYAGTNAIILVAAYREVTDTTMANPATAPPMLTLNEAVAANAIPLVGTPPFPGERLEPMITGVPLVVGARKGFPNFNEFSMQTYISVSRLLEFRRDLISGPVTLTNQMYTLILTNTLGIEAWNAYSNSYPRNLQLSGQVQLTTVVTNLTDSGPGYTLLTNVLSQGFSTNIPAGSWPGWTSLLQLPASFVLPLGNGTPSVITQSSYVDQPSSLQPLNHSFSQDGSFYMPRFWLNLNVRLLFVLVDTDAQRIVDYVNLDHWEPTVDITGKLAETADCSGMLSSLSDPTVLWCTNRVNNSNDSSVPTIGVRNQIAVGLGLGPVSSRGLLLDPYTGIDIAAAIDTFRYNLMGWSPIFSQDQGKTFYRSNVFYAPLVPYTPIYEHTSWQANDPLVHYTMEDLTDTRLLSESNRVNFVSQYPPLSNLGILNLRYEPWGGNPFQSSSIMPAFQLAAKDPLVHRADDWDFPTNQTLSTTWIGRVHRGTPWQTLFLKSTNVLLQTSSPAADLTAWESWTGNTLTRPDWQGNGDLVPDALGTAPTNDWRLVSRLAPLFNTNDVRLLASANQSTPEAWSALLDGLSAVTNPVPGEFDWITISSNSPSAMALGRALVGSQALQGNNLFNGVGDILTTPELTVGSPWLNTTNGVVDDASYELLASELLARLRPDSFGSVELLNSSGLALFTFTGFDDYDYLVQTSSDLLGWTDLGVFHPTNSTFIFTNSVSGDSHHFVRSCLVP